MRYQIHTVYLQPLDPLQCETFCGSNKMLIKNILKLVPNNHSEPSQTFKKELLVKQPNS